MQITSHWEYPVVNKKQASLNHLLLQVEAPSVSTTPNRQPLVVVLAIDKSWSMKGEKLEATLGAASQFISWLTRHDHLGIVAYASDVQQVQPLVSLTEKKSIINKLHTVQLGAATNLSGGWLQALKMAENANVENAIKRVILLSDGLATMGIQENEKLYEISEKYAQLSITTTTIGFGTDFNEESLSAIARFGNGNFYFADSPEKVSAIFFEEFGNIGSIYAQASELKVKLPYGVIVREVLEDYPYHVINNELQIKLGDIRHDDIKNIVIAFEQKLENSSDLEINLEYYDVHDLESKQIESKTSLEAGAESSNPDQEVQLQLLIAWAGKTMLESSRMAENDIDGAIEILNNMIHRLKENFSLNTQTLVPLCERLESMQKSLKNDAITTRKHLVASSVALNKERSDLTIINESKFHNKIFECNWSGNLDMYNSPQLKQLIQNKINEGYRYVILDLSGTPFIDSSSIGALIQTSNWLTRRLGLLVVANLSNTLEKLFKQTRLDSYIPVAESITGARMVIDSRRASA